MRRIRVIHVLLLVLLLAAASVPWWIDIMQYFPLKTTAGARNKGEPDHDFRNRIRRIEAALKQADHAIAEMRRELLALKGYIQTKGPGQ